MEKETQVTLNGGDNEEFKTEVKRLLSRVESAILDMVQSFNQFRNVVDSRLEKLESELKAMRMGVIKEVVMETSQIASCPIVSKQDENG